MKPMEHRSPADVDATPPSRERYWKRLAPGIYDDGKGIRAVVNIAAGRKEKRFPRDAGIRELERWRRNTTAQLERRHPNRRAGTAPRGTFSVDLKRYLGMIAIASWGSRRSELRAWEVRLGILRRDRVTTDHARTAIKVWVDDGVSPKTIVNRCRALSAMYRTLDGPDAWTPLVGVRLPKVRRRKPLRVSVETIRGVEANLRATGDVKTHARFMVLTATGARPVHLKRAEKTDVDLLRRNWNVPSAKNTEPLELWLNNDMVAAFEALIAADAWGDFKSEEYAKAIRAAGWPKHVRPYNAKHTFGQDLADLGFSRETIADWYGHTSPATTKIYTGSAKLRRMSEAIDGRLGWGPAPAPLAAGLAVDVDRLTLDERKALLRALLAEELKHLGR
jgi:site-specific recombinase XerC